MSAGGFISWAPFSRRTETLAKEFQLDLAFVRTPWPKRPWTTPIKYPWQAVRTLQALRARQPQELWVMDPPSPLVAIAGSWAARHDVPLVVDMHTAAFTAPEWRLLRPLELPALRAAAAVVVTNESLAREVRSWGARAFVLPDPLPAPLRPITSVPVADLVTIVATFSKDEPLDVLPAVARALPDVRFAVTGSPRGDLSDWPANLTATGFLDDQEYWEQLAASAAVVVLTTRPDTLLSGGYEAMAVGRPLVTSDHEVLRDYYEEAALYCGADSSSMVAAIQRVLHEGHELAASLVDLRERRVVEWRQEAERLRVAVGRGS